LETILKEEEGFLTLNDHKFLHYDCVVKKLSESFKQSEVEFVLECLALQRKLIVEQEGGNTIIKIRLSRGPAADYNQTDSSVIKLHETVKLLEKEVEKTETAICDSRAKAKECLRKGSKETAKTHLRNGKRLEKSLCIKANQMEHLQNMLEQIIDAQNNQEVLQAYKIALASLKGSVAGCSVGEGEETMEDLAEVLDKVREMGNILGDGDKLDDSDLIDLEEELEQLQNEHKEQGEKVSDPDDRLMKALEELEIVDDKLGDNNKARKQAADFAL